jgi:hypothetical protein
VILSGGLFLEDAQPSPLNPTLPMFPYVTTFMARLLSPHLQNIFLFHLNPHTSYLIHSLSSLTAAKEKREATCMVATVG